MTDLVEELLADDPDAGTEINHCFWQACHGGQLRTVQHLLARGADINSRPDYAEDLPIQIATSPGTGRSTLVSWLRDQGAVEAVPVPGG